MTRADKIKEYIKERYGVELNETSLEQTEFRFQGCDGFECPPECLHENAKWNDYPECSKCKYNDFWEQEDDDKFIKALEDIQIISEALIGICEHECYAYGEEEALALAHEYLGGEYVLSNF